MRWEWPFKTDKEFWLWAMDENAEVCDQDEDLILHFPEGLPLLAAAADVPQCPKDLYCCGVLEDYAGEIIRRAEPGELAALRATAVQAANGTQPHTRRFAAYAERLLGYLTPHGPVKRTLAEQMALDLLSTPTHVDKAIRPVLDGLVIQVTATGKHWRCGRPGMNQDALYINRRTGAWRLAFRRSLTADELAKL